MNIQSDKNLTIEELATNHETWRHIHRVQHHLNRFVKSLIDRGHRHDQSKLAPPEVTIFTAHTPFPEHITYGSDEYREQMKKITPALEHHYAENSHHPEHFENGIEGMTLLDLVEMFADWEAAGERHADGDILRSIEVNAKRFGIGEQLTQILYNTTKE